MRFIAAVFGLIFCSNMAWSFPLEATSGRTEFLAIGRPAAIKIQGHGPGPTGDLVLVKAAAEYILRGEARLDLDLLETGIGMRDRHMKEKYLETGKFKEAVLKLNDVHVPAELLRSGGEFKTNGQLSLHGTERPIDVSIRFTKEGEKIKALSAFKLKLSDYTIEIPKFSGITVADEVEVKTETAVSQLVISEAK